MHQEGKDDSDEKVYSLSSDKKSSDITHKVIEEIMQHINIELIPDELEIKIYEIVFESLYQQRNNIFDCSSKLCCRK